MAAVSVHFTILDAKGKSSRTTVHVPTGFSLSQYTQFGTAMAQLIANISEGQITEVSVSFPVDLSGAALRAAALVGADIFKKLFVQARSAVAGLLAKFNIPTYDESNTVSGSDALNEADPDALLLIALVETGANISGEIIQPVDLRGNDLEDVSIMREIFRKF